MIPRKEGRLSVGSLLRRIKKTCDYLFSFTQTGLGECDSAQALKEFNKIYEWLLELRRRRLSERLAREVISTLNEITVTIWLLPRIARDESLKGTCKRIENIFMVSACHLRLQCMKPS